MKKILLLILLILVNLPQTGCEAEADPVPVNPNMRRNPEDPTHLIRLGGWGLLCPDYVEDNRRMNDQPSNVLGQMEVEFHAGGGEFVNYHCGCPTPLTPWRVDPAYRRLIPPGLADWWLPLNNDDYAAMFERRYWNSEVDIDVKAFKCHDLDESCLDEEAPAMDGFIKTEVFPIINYSATGNPMAPVGSTPIYPSCDIPLGAAVAFNLWGRPMPHFGLPACTVQVTKTAFFPVTDIMQENGFPLSPVHVSRCLRQHHVIDQEDRYVRFEPYEMEALLSSLKLAGYGDQALAQMGFLGGGHIDSPAWDPQNPEEPHPAWAVAFQQVQADAWPEVTQCLMEEMRAYVAQFEREDADGDMVCDAIDTCDETPNFDEINADWDYLAMGDETPDDDLHHASCDNCDLAFNPDQADADGDGIGDACDCSNWDVEDTDGDLFNDSCDNCPERANRGQEDVDGDELGNACDPCPADTANDRDQDGHCETQDNCDLIANPQQADEDMDQVGDLCEPDTDGDGIIDDHDNCDELASADQTDDDGDGLGNVCDPCPDMHSVHDDSDGDCVADENGDDNCPHEANPGQENSDNDQHGDLCDNCPHTSNPPQLDEDHDDIGDECDNCLGTRNPNQEDADRDGSGDACEVANPVNVWFVGAQKYADYDRLIQGNAVSAPYQIAGVNQIRRATYEILSGGQVIRPAQAIPPIAGVIRFAPGLNARPGWYQVRISLLLDGGLTVSANHDFVIYRLSVFLPQNAIAQEGADNAAGHIVTEANLYVNNDDDNRDGIRDDSQNQNLGENDLLGLEPRIEPALPGQMSINIENNGQFPEGPSIRFWESPFRSRPLEMPFLPEGNRENFFLEGLRAVSSQQQPLAISLSFDVSEGGGRSVSLPEKIVPMSLVQLDIVQDRDNNAIIACEENQQEDCPIGQIDLTNEPVEHLLIALWDQAYYHNDRNEVAVYNEAAPARNFIDRDSRRFYVRVINPRANANPNIADRIDAGGQNGVLLGTVTRQGEPFDDMTGLTLEETGRNTGIFASRSQILTTFDVSTDALNPAENDADCNGSGNRESMKCSDDNFMAHDGFSGTAFDDSPNDRTHKVTIDDLVRVHYRAFDEMPEFTQSTGVCGEKKTLYLKLAVMKEPYMDIGANPGQENRPDQFDFSDSNGNGVCDCIDFNANGFCSFDEYECEYFADTFDDAVAQEGGDPFRERLPAGELVRQEGVFGPVISESYLRSMVERANLLWQQACINVIADEEVVYLDMPEHNADGEPLLAGYFDHPERTLETNIIGGIPFDLENHDSLGVVIMPYLTNAYRSLSMLDDADNDDLMPKSFIVASTYSQANLSQEIASVLARMPSSTDYVWNKSTYFFPYRLGDRGYNPRSTFHVNHHRRIPKEYIDIIHDSPDARGHLYLKDYVPSSRPEQ